MRIPPELQVCLVAGDRALHAQVQALFTVAGARVGSYDTAEALFSGLQGESPCCMAVTAALPGMSGLELLHALHARDAKLPVVVIVEADDVDAAVAAVRMGAAEVLEQPVSAQRLAQALVGVARSPGDDASGCRAGQRPACECPRER